MDEPSSFLLEPVDPSSSCCCLPPDSAVNPDCLHNKDPLDKIGDNDNDSSEIEKLMNRGEYLRKLRELERQDELERNKGEEDQEQLERIDSKEQLLETLPSGETILSYETFLKSQRIYDDLKHVDCKYIDYGSIEGQGTLVIEQDKSLGKGGFCWDAAFILGEYFVHEYRRTQDEILGERARILELGTGTGLCGMIIAKALPVHVDLTDLSNLMPLVQRNVDRNFSDSEKSSALGSVSAFILDWSEPTVDQPYDYVLGADVVASLYDPIALAQTIYQVSHEGSTVYVSFKERLSTIHRQFEQRMGDLFNDIQIVSSKISSRNRNPEVKIMIARRKKRLNEDMGL